MKRTPQQQIDELEYLNVQLLEYIELTRELLECYCKVNQSQQKICLELQGKVSMLENAFSLDN